jgi:hypothetical protein
MFFVIIYVIYSQLYGPAVSQSDVEIPWEMKDFCHSARLQTRATTRTSEKITHEAVVFTVAILGPVARSPNCKSCGAKEREGSVHFVHVKRTDCAFRVRQSCGWKSQSGVNECRAIRIFILTLA